MDVPNNIPLHVLDPFKESLNSLLVIAFTPTNSGNYHIALSICHGASRYCEVPVGKSVMHFAVFSKTQEDAGRALAVTRFASSWKGTLFFANGKMLKSSCRIADVLECYLNSMACEDWKAHCFEVIDDPLAKPLETKLSLSITVSETPPAKTVVSIDRYVFPCKYLRLWFRFQTDHPSDFVMQIHAGAVNQDCNICPHFNQNEYKKIGIKKVLRDATHNWSPSPIFRPTED